MRISISYERTEHLVDQILCYELGIDWVFGEHIHKVAWWTEKEQVAYEG